ncbi:MULTISPECIES: ABC transporter ATP-binding protein [Lysinibacillus]|uniref:ABC transporter ATP-binding protein n=1 Tax=Lysinibacillus TaxID=400634 RepID=UPI00214CD01D|nr:MULTISPECIES: ABC transporter ATP-binding protein [Lysinibacillus]UNT57742.1 ABC transporter ATP-binding protein [Lysinibacillus capsici]UUV27579.1 ABC transporter ATP-binding protein [Lysinibacillus sp. FN11]UYB49922.1 ABC transporter ATP-binding protein [Lysinibacillus capsici]WDU81956.1 ABC transporter ATP-binding protein [Lysinibacillus sp. G01H]
MENLASGYEQVRVFEGLNLTIEEGKVTTIIGPNGCGKSTLLKTIGRILKKQQGTVYLQEQNMQNLSTKDIAKKLAILSQTPIAPGQLKVEELIAYGRYPHRNNVNRLTNKDEEMIEWALTVTNTMEYRNRELAQLSGGQRQRVWLAMALAQETNILLLDEPTTYLDMAHQLEVLDIVKSLNEQHSCTIVMVLHDINHAARYSDHLIAMRNGIIMQTGTPQEILSAEVMRKVFNIDARIMEDPVTNTPVCYGYEILKEDI